MLDFSSKGGEAKFKIRNQVCWHISAILALGRLRQEDNSELETLSQKVNIPITTLKTLTPSEKYWLFLNVEETC